MLEILYYIFIFPVEQVLEWALFTLFKATKNYGVSIILLSFVMQLFMLKLTFYFDKKAASFGALKAQCDSKIKEFKRVFKGAELQSYIRTLYKQKHFHPIFALFGLGGLALQIPFFIAMIHLVENAEYLQSVRFLWIDDLSKPDSIMLFGFSIHILPLLMTAFTLINVFYSSKELGSRIQGSLIALLFLVLLYSMPSALVLYWTCNMLFSLLKEVFKRHSACGDFSGNAAPTSLRHTTSASHSLALHNPKNSLTILECQDSNTTKSKQDSKTSTLSNTIAESTLYKHNEKSAILECRDSITSHLSQNTRIADSLSCHTEQSEVSKKRDSNNIESTKSDSNNANSSKNTKLSGKAIQPQGKLKTLFFNIFTPHTAIDSKTYTTYRNISILAILNICFMICVFSPYALYSSDVSQFDVSQTYQTLGALFGFFILSSFGFIYFTSFFYKTRLLKIGAYGVSVILCIGLVYTFVLDYNVVTGESYSQLDNFMFKNPTNLSAPFAKYVDLLVGVLACIIILILLIREGLFKNMLLCFFIGFCIVGIFNFAHIVAQKTNLSHHNTSLSKEMIPDLQSLLPPFHHDLTSFSKDKENVLVLLFDGFSGSHLQIIFEQFPELKQEFEGFTYYPNTLSLDGGTVDTAHTILTGFKTSTFANRKKSLEQFYQTNNIALKQTFINIRNKGFKIQSYNMPHINSYDDLGENINIYHTEYAVKWFFGSQKDYSDYYEKLYNLSSMIHSLQASSIPVGELVSLGLFYFSPYVGRTRIYTLRLTNEEDFADYAWIFAIDKIKNVQYLSGINTTSQLPSIVRNLNVDSQYPTFKYIHTLHTHYPWILDSQTCVPTLSKNMTSLPQQFKPFLPNPRHYDNEVCAIKETKILLDFLRQNNIYDNTMIVLVSDHSYNDLPAHNMPNQPSFANNPNPLLLIKNFSAKGVIKTDTRLMSNADVYGILCDELGVEHCDETNILKHYPKHRSIVHTLNVHWTDEAQRADHLNLEKIWLVKDSVLDPKKFTDITESVKNGTFKIDGIEH